MILVDTSVWIDFLRNKKNDQVSKLDTLIRERIPFGINEFIYQELLQGTKDVQEFKLLKSYLDTQRFYPLPNEKTPYAEAAKRYFLCRREGYTIRSSIDMLIVQTCISHKLSLLHNDKDFEKIAKIEKKLHFY